jgi:hypothetical protein
MSVREYLRKMFFPTIEERKERLARVKENEDLRDQEEYYKEKKRARVKKQLEGINNMYSGWMQGWNEPLKKDEKKDEKK